MIIHLGEWLCETPYACQSPSPYTVGADTA
jgi:hypothetical protein